MWKKVVSSIEADGLTSIYQSSATEYVPEPSFVCGGETYDNDHVVLIENITKEVGFMDMFLLACKIIHDSLVMLMEQDIPTNYKGVMVDLEYKI